jgi:hypothetical protein
MKKAMLNVLVAEAAALEAVTVADSEDLNLLPEEASAADTAVATADPVMMVVTTVADGTLDMAAATADPVTMVVTTVADGILDMAAATADPVTMVVTTAVDGTLILIMVTGMVAFGELRVGTKAGLVLVGTKDGAGTKNMNFLIGGAQSGFFPCSFLSKL